MFRTDKFKKSDYFLGACSLGIQEERLYNAWLNICGDTDAYIFKSGGDFFARGTKEEKSYAEGFFQGWKKALTMAGDNPWRSADDLPEGPTRKVLLWVTINNGDEAILSKWCAFNQEFLIDSIYEVKIKYWKEIVGPE